MATFGSTTKVFTVSMAQKAECLAAQDGLTVSDLLIEAFQAYFVDGIGRPLANIAEYAATHNPHGYIEADTPRLIDEVRAAKVSDAVRALDQASTTP